MAKHKCLVGKVDLTKGLVSGSGGFERTLHGSSPTVGHCVVRSKVVIGPVFFRVLIELVVPSHMPWDRGHHLYPFVMSEEFFFFSLAGVSIFSGGLRRVRLRERRQGCGLFLGHRLSLHQHVMS